MVSGRKTRPTLVISRKEKKTESVAVGGTMPCNKWAIGGRMPQHHLQRKEGIDGSGRKNNLALVGVECKNALNGGSGRLINKLINK